MPTPEEYWYRAEALVKLAAAATQLYAREMLLERAAEFRQMAARHFATACSERAAQERRSWGSNQRRRRRLECFFSDAANGPPVFGAAATHATIKEKA